MDVVVIDTPSLGDRSYLVHDGTSALVVDPQRDIDRVLAAADQAGVRITHVAETHLHNDYVTGGLALANQLGVPYLVAADADVQFEREPITDQQELQVGELQVTVVATPGHTDNHVSYVVRHGGRQAVFSGGSLLFGSVGRTDLLGPELTDRLTHEQWHSVRRLADQADDQAELYPTHGFGSFCSSGPATGAASSTIAEQRAHNHALTDSDVEHFVRELIAGLSAYPAYYAHMGPANAKGPQALDLTLPAPVDADVLRQRIEDGQWVVDLRNRVAFSTSHLAGTVSFEYGNGSMFTTFLGWLAPWGQPLTLLGSKDDVSAAFRDLSRIGIDRPDVAIGENPSGIAPELATASYPHVSWDELAASRGGSDVVVLDVRRTDEFEQSHIQGAVNVPLHELEARIGDVPAGQVWVHCGSGYRSSIAASLLQRAGRDVCYVDGNFPDAASHGLPVVPA